jgi:hypothetical protein
MPCFALPLLNIGIQAVISTTSEEHEVIMHDPVSLFMSGTHCLYETATESIK